MPEMFCESVDPCMRESVNPCIRAPQTLELVDSKARHCLHDG